MWQRFIKWLSVQLDTEDMSQIYDHINSSSNVQLMADFCQFLEADNG